ncbi:Hypothetical predicted protein [Octopus vulgaris]|uniref:Uncharacterized protein n=1 Tax=Octopus vulgaris TaxID=6645 RepID=A0AA36AH55_OCTVU|nr:Hypothetical predicted protein [Octopus vulgaris]
MELVIDVGSSEFLLHGHLLQNALIQDERKRVIENRTNSELTRYGRSNKPQSGFDIDKANICIVFYIDKSHTFVRDGYNGFNKVQYMTGTYFVDVGDI